MALYTLEALNVRGDMMGNAHCIFPNKAAKPFEGDTNLSTLDVNYLMKSCLTISAEMELEALLKMFMNVVIECSGAQHGYMLLIENGSLFVRAESHIREKQVRTVNQKLDDAIGICKAIVHYVFQTGERVILNNATKEGMFKEKPEVQEMHLCSVLCVPLIKHSRMIGILYLENRLSNGVFTVDKTQMMELLTLQAAISLENSRLVREDIAERKRAEDQLRAASLYARSLIEASLDPLVTISPEGKITDVNEATVKVTGVSRWNLIGTDFSDYFTEPEKAREGYQRVFKQGFVTDYPLTIWNKNGKLVDVLYNASLYKDAAGKVLGVFAAARDVTESKAVMREFTETKNFLNNILESSTKYSIIGKDLNHKILSWNEGAVRNYGYTAEEIIGIDSSILHAPQDIQSGAVDKMLEIAFEKGLAECEFQRVRKDGSRFMANVVVTRRNDFSGNPIGYLLMSTDISEKKQAEEQLRQASQYSRSLIEASLDPLVTISPEGKITDVNEATVKVTGIQRDKLISTDFSDYFTQPDKAREGYRKVFEQGFVTDYPLTIRNKAGRLTEVLYNASVYRDVQGNVLGVFAAARDVTSQKKAEAKIAEQRAREKKLNQVLRASEERYRDIVETASEGIWVIDKYDRIDFANKKMAEMLACTTTEIIGKYLHEFIENQYTAEMYNGSNLGRQVIPNKYEFKLRRKNGKELWVILSTNPRFDLNGEYSGSLAMVTDITERKQFEKEMARLDRLNVVGEMAAGIGHEVRNPMTSVRGFIQLLANKESDPDKLEYYDIMIGELDRANSIITEFLSLAKDRAVKLTPFLLNNIVNSLYPLLSSDAMKQDKHIMLKKGDISTIFLDEKEIRQLIINLVRNGLEAMPPGGVLTIGTYEEKDEVVLFVEDEGTGIKPEVYDKLGTPFVTTKDEGTGLGLSICYSIANKHNAKIVVKTGSTGTTFYVRFNTVRQEFSRL